MSESVTDAAEVTETATDENQEQQKKPTETVDFWKQKAREQESRAKSNAAAAKRLAELEEAQKSEAEKVADRIAKAEAEAASVPAKVAEALRAYWIETEQIDTEKADLYLTGNTPELITKQFKGLVADSDKRNRRNHVPREGENPNGQPTSDVREFTRNLFARNE